MGFDCIGTTLSGYTEATKGKSLPDFELVEKLVKNFSIPIVAEGGVSTPEELKKMFDLGVYTAVVGSAITRPMEITQRFIKAMQ